MLSVSAAPKVGEAEVFADAGLEDIRLPYPIQPANADRILALLDRVRLSIIVDDVDVASGWSSAMTRGATDAGCARQG